MSRPAWHPEATLHTQVSLVTLLGIGPAVTDVRVLKAVHEHDGVVMTTAALAVALGVAEDEADARITELTKDGLLSSPTQCRSRGGVWSEIGVKVTENGRGVLEAESRASGSRAHTPCDGSDGLSAKEQHGAETGQPAHTPVAASVV